MEAQSHGTEGSSSKRNCSNTSSNTATADFSLRKWRKGQRSNNYELSFRLGESTSVPKTGVYEVRKAGALNSSCWGREHSCEANTPWKTQTTAFCLAAGCLSPNSRCVPHPAGAPGQPGGQRGPEAGAARRPQLCCSGRPTRGSPEKSKAAEPRVPPALARRMRGGCAGYPDPRTPRPHHTAPAGVGPRRVNNTLTRVNTRGKDSVGNFCRQRLNLT